MPAILFVFNMADKTEVDGKWDIEQSTKMWFGEDSEIYEYFREPKVIYIPEMTSNHRQYDIQLM